MTVVTLGDSNAGVELLGLGSDSLRARCCQGLRVITYVVTSGGAASAANDGDGRAADVPRSTE